MEMNCQLLPEHKVILTDYVVALSLEENWSNASVDANRVVVIAPELMEFCQYDQVFEK